MKSSRKQEGKLIGYDEAPIYIDAVNLIQLERLQLQEATGEACTSLSICNGSSCSKEIGNEEQASSSSSRAMSLGKIGTDESSFPSDSIGRNRVETGQTSNCVTENLPTGGLHNISAKSRLYEICAAKYWNPPSFVCIKEDGPSHLKEFSFKVTVEIEEAPTTIVECIGGPRARKKAAEEHAAEGALWYLQHQGYLPDTK